MATLHPQVCTAVPSQEQQCSIHTARVKGSRPAAEIWRMCCEDKERDHRVIPPPCMMD